MSHLKWFVDAVKPFVVDKEVDIFLNTFEGIVHPSKHCVFLEIPWDYCRNRVAQFLTYVAYLELDAAAMHDLYSLAYHDDVVMEFHCVLSYLWLNALRGSSTTLRLL